MGMIIPGWIVHVVIGGVLGFLIGELVADFKWTDKIRQEKQEKQRIENEKNEQRLRMKFQQANIPPGTMIPIQNTGKSILFEEMKEMYKNREIQDLNEGEDLIEKMLRDAASRK